MLPPVRCVVTGHTPTGKSFVVQDSPVSGRIIWATSTTPADNGDPDDSATKAASRLEPVSNGSVFRLVELPPRQALAARSKEEQEIFFSELFASLEASHCRVDTTASPGMHKTSTIDYVVVLRGEVVLLLDEEQVTLQAGDLVVQRGTNHHWFAGGDEPALIAVVMLSALPT